MAPKNPSKSLTRQALEYRAEITSAMFVGEIKDGGSGKIEIDAAAEYTAMKVEQAREQWDEDNSHRIPAPNMESLRQEHLTKRTMLRWRYGLAITVVVLGFIAVAGLSASGHAA